MPSKEVYRATSEVTRENQKGIANLMVIRNFSASRPDRFIFGDQTPVTTGKSSTSVPNPVSVFSIQPGNLTGDDKFAMRNASEARQDGSIPLCGSGTTGTEFRVTGKYDLPSRTNQGEIRLATSNGASSGWSLPTLA